MTLGFIQSMFLGYKQPLSWKDSRHNCSGIECDRCQCGSCAYYGGWPAASCHCPYSSSSESSGTSPWTDITQGLPQKRPAGTILDVAPGRELRQKNKLDYRSMLRYGRE
jgi:hypothetical protein